VAARTLVAWTANHVDFEITADDTDGRAASVPAPGTEAREELRMQLVTLSLQLLGATKPLSRRVRRI
jgi:hypothetical protein